MRSVSLSLGWCRVLMTPALILVRDLIKYVLCHRASESMLTKYSLMGIVQPGCTSALVLVACKLDFTLIRHSGRWRRLDQYL